MDKAFDFQTVDLRSNPTRILLTFFFFLVFVFVLPFVFFPGYFLIKHGILFKKFARVEFESCFHLFLCCSFLNLNFFFELKKFI